MKNANALHQSGYLDSVPVILCLKKQIDFAKALLSFWAGGYWVIPVSPDLNELHLNQIKETTGALYFDEDDWIEIQKKDFILNRSTKYKESGIYHLTSGSTGAPKLCIRTVEALINEGKDYQKKFNILNSDKIMSLCPIYHSFALGGALMSAIVSGAYFHAIDFFYPRTAIDSIIREKITYITSVPFLAEIICKIPIKNKENYSVRTVVIGAGKVTECLNDKFFNRFGVKLSVNYGSTETGGLISRNGQEPFESLGKPMDSVTVKLCDDNGHIVDRGMEGEAFVKTKSMLSSYYLQQVMLDSDGFFAMGDILKQDHEGYFYLVGRKRCFVKIGGKSVSTKEIETSLKDFDGITDCYVDIKSQPSSDYHIVAYIVSCKEISQWEIRDFCKKRLENYKIPSDFIFVNQIPRNKLGKIVKEQLLKL